MVKNKTPEAWSGYNPNMAHLWICRCVAYAQVHEVKRKKHDNLDEKYIFIGYSEESKAYKLYNPLIKKVVVSKDVVLNEAEAWSWSNEETVKPVVNELDEPLHVSRTAPVVALQLILGSSYVVKLLKYFREF